MAMAAVGEKGVALGGGVWPIQGQLQALGWVEGSTQKSEGWSS